MGLVGQHRGARVGGGTELADIRPFRTGDRLRRIHWPVSLRTGALHVTTTYADQDAEVRLVVDAMRDLGERASTHGRRSSLDVAVEAAGAVAAHYLGTGDRVGLSVLGGAGVVEVPAVGGHRQLARVLLGLGRAEPSRGTVGEERALRAQLSRSMPPGAFVVLLSALVSAEPLAHAVRLARSGHAVVVVDTLPAELSGRGHRRGPALGSRGSTTPCSPGSCGACALLDREREARRCAAAGVPVIAWRGPGSLDTVLRGAPAAPGPPGGDPMIRNRTWRSRDGGHRRSAPTSSSSSWPAPSLPGFVPFALGGAGSSPRAGRSRARRDGGRSPSS